MTTAHLYCSKCRDNLGQGIARYKNSSDDFRNVDVVAELRPGVFQCKCRQCLHIWNSRAEEARQIWRRRRG